MASSVGQIPNYNDSFFVALHISESPKDFQIRRIRPEYLNYTLYVILKYTQASKNACGILTVYHPNNQRILF